jgi:DNA polymerase V
MQSTMFALIDCNNFYVSCERAFDPKLRDRPVVILSNNDGCAISRSNEAKKLGIGMGEPFFQMRATVAKHNVAVLSSNFALYGDMSARVMNIIYNSMPEVEVYSIDEAFVNLTSMQNSFDIYKTCQQLVKKLEQYTGIPVSIGIASSRTLAKAANQIAKKQNIPGRVFYFDSAEKTKQILADFKVRDVWGIGRQLEKRLHAMGVVTALELINLPIAIIKNSFSINVQRTVRELKGESCIKLQDNAENRKQIMVSRSFGHRVTELEQLQEAIATYASVACEKLRQQRLIAGGFHVFLHTGLHGASDTVYENSKYVHLPNPSFDTRTIINLAKLALKKLFKPGFRYQKVGIILAELSTADSMQIDIFGDNNLAQSENLMGLIDEINHKLGKTTLQFAAAGLAKPWKRQATKLSKRYTSSWQELPIAVLL